MTEPGQDPDEVRVNRGMFLKSSQEPGVAIPESVYIRLEDRLDACRATGWGDLWLAGGGVGGGLVGAALVTVLSLGTTAPSATRAILWMLAALGASVFVLSLAAYLTQRHDRDKEITGLKADMEMYRKRSDLARKRTAALLAGGLLLRARDA
jgi:hypothetical protein